MAAATLIRSEPAVPWYEVAHRAWQAAGDGGNCLVLLAATGTTPPPYGELTLEESRRAARFLRDDDRKAFVLARRLVRFLLDLPAAPFSRTAYGKPFVAGAPAFSISHSKGVVAVAFCPAGLGDRIGVDVEAIRTDLHVDDLISLVCHPNELAVLSAMSGETKRSMFYRCWTRKEAVLKAMGSGLSSALSVDVSLFHNSPMIHGPPAMRIWDLPPSGNWAMALAAPVRIGSPVLLHLGDESNPAAPPSCVG